MNNSFKALNSVEKAACTKGDKRVAAGTEPTAFQAACMTKRDRNAAPARRAPARPNLNSPPQIAKRAAIAAKGVVIKPIVSVGSAPTAQRRIAPTLASKAPNAPAHVPAAAAGKLAELSRALDAANKRADAAEKALEQFTGKLASPDALAERHEAGLSWAQATYERIDATEDPIGHAITHRQLSWHGAVVNLLPHSDKGKKLRVQPGRPRPALVFIPGDGSADAMQYRNAGSVVVYLDREEQADGTFMYLDEPIYYTAAELQALRPEHNGGYVSSDTVVHPEHWDTVAELAATMTAAAQ